jgi:hypothetical protein
MALEEPSVVATICVGRARVDAIGIAYWGSICAGRIGSIVVGVGCAIGVEVIFLAGIFILAWGGLVS